MDTLFRNILRILQLLWIVLLTALIGNVIASNINAAGSAEAAVNFAMFAIVLSWLAALYGLVANYVESISMAIAHLALDGLATLFTLIAAIVLAAKLKAVNCADAGDRHDHPDDWIAFGSADDQKRCREIQASTVFMWFLWACFAVSLFFTATSWRRAGGSMGSVRSGRPHMSQVGV